MVLGAVCGGPSTPLPAVVPLTIERAIGVVAVALVPVTLMVRLKDALGMVWPS